MVTPPLLSPSVMYHCAYSVTLPLIVNVLPGSYSVPVPSAEVFQKPNVAPVLVRLPLFALTVTCAPLA